jgi:hypothetical protein
VAQVVCDACAEELQDCLFLCPKTGEGDLRIWSRRDKGEFLWGKDMTREGFAVTTNRLDINTYRSFRKDTSNGLFAMGEVEMEG